MKRVFLVIAVLMAALALPHAAHAQYGGAQGFLIDPPQGYPGDRVNLLGTGCGPRSTVTFVITETNTGWTQTTSGSDADGSFFVGGVEIPDLPPGTYTVEARCSVPGPQGTSVLRATLTVLARVDAGAAGTGRGAPGSLAFTGNRAPETWLKAGVALVAAGALLAFVMKRKKEDATPVA